MSRLTGSLMLLFFLINGLGAQTPQASDVGRILELAEESLENGHNAWALEGFSQLLERELTPEQESRRDFGLAKTQLALGEPGTALEILLDFIETHTESINYPEAVYQLGRAYLMLDEYETAIIQFNRFLNDYGENQLTGNTFFWIGESAFQLGHWEQAREFYMMVIQRYPTSFKVEAARYRLALIDIRTREEELMELLQWSHEEHLESLALLQRREAEYRQALQEYQQQLLHTQPGANDSTLIPPAATSSSRSQLLDLKERLLAVQEFYISLLLQEINQ